jgi:hypothetical protein
VLLASVALLAAVIGCKPTAEGENKKWDGYVASVAKHSEKYPNFKGLLDGHLEAAKKDMEAAKKEGDAEKKAEAMKAANEKLYDVVGKLDAYQSKRAEVKKKMNDSALRKAPSGQVEDAKKAAKKALKKSKEKLEGAKPESIDQLKELVVAARGDLITAANGLDRVIKKGKKKKKKKKKS